ncbi:MAG: nucleoside-diphosphate sugar epimerase/dehydratase [Candidatus Izemoplasmatales bacterium]|nr:nucleoside-diphosphate sugar epimerase/dehydratase [Candidatus Izemoplasmatales bacterium]MDD4595297.1 nucleoside-diphosphate sugar epimerase/dehydratase [Candidatus Izemoplasmatales bacterium]
MKKHNSETTGEYMKKIRVVQYMLLDALCIALTYIFAFMSLATPSSDRFTMSDFWQAVLILPFVIVFKIIIFYITKLYRMVLDNVGFDEIFRIFVAVIFTNITIAIFFLAIPDFQFIPELVLLFTSVLEAVLLIFTRMSKRIFKYLKYRKNGRPGKRTLLIGAGAGGKLVFDEIRNSMELLLNPVAFVDDDSMKIGKIMSGLPIYGPISETPKLIDDLKIEEVIIAIANIDGKRFQEIIQIVTERPVKVKRLPKFKELKKDAPKTLLEVNVEDLLSRDVVELNGEGVAEFITGKRIMVTGAGGSIGSELVRQIIAKQPSELMLVDIYENGIYDLQMELNNKYQDDLNQVSRKVLIGSVYNYERMKNIFADFKPELVFHAAAYKHVPLMEDSAVEAVRTNVIGTYNIARLCDEYHVQKMVLVSSDKAVRPTNVMGATKRFAEMIIQYFNCNSETNYSAVRFGNVLGSNGSVIPLFKKQIENGGPLTVTDRRIIRYFMTIPEAVSLILQSATFAKGGEIFILDMGEPVKIIDMAEKMIMLTGLRPYIDIDIRITGLRPGEKLFEEMLVDKTENHIKTNNKKIYIENLMNIEEIEKDIEYIKQTFESLNNCEIKEMVGKIVSTYSVKN